MTMPRYHDIKDTPLPTDAELVPHVQSMLEGGYRRQVWVMLLDSEHRPLPVLMPSDVPAEPDPEDVLGLGDFLRCIAMECPGAVLVLTFERPGPAEIVQRDRRWLRLLREAALASEFPFRGPFLLLGNSVRQVPPDEYLTAAWVDTDEM